MWHYFLVLAVGYTPFLEVMWYVREAVMDDKFLSVKMFVAGFKIT